MPIRIIRDNERLVYQHGDAKIFYRRVPIHIRRQIFSRHTRRGQVDAHGVMEELLRYAVLGWEGVVDQNKTPVPYQPELLDYLPAEVTDGLADALNAANPEEQETKNSETGSTASSH